MKNIKIFAIAAAAGLVPASGRCEGKSAWQTLKDGMSAQVEVVDAPPIKAKENGSGRKGADAEAADSGVGLLQRLFQGYKALEGRSIVQPGDPFYEDAVLLRRLNGRQLQVTGFLEVKIGEPNILGRREAVLYVREPAGEMLVMSARRAPLLVFATYRREDMDKWAARFPMGRLMTVTLTVSYNYRSVDNWPFIVDKVEPSGAEEHRPGSVRASLQGAVAEVTETAALARSVEASAAQEIVRRPGFELAKEWSVTAGKIAGELEAERTKLLEAARSSDTALAREIEIAKSLLAPAKRYLARAKTYLDALKEAGRPSPLPRDLAEENERSREEFRRLKRLY